MKLLTFAHRGEAQVFFLNLNYKPVAFFFDGLFRNEDSFLLITGEGPLAASEKTMAVLSTFHQEIDFVINIGVAGSLNTALKLHDLVWVRTSYAHHAERLEFKSYTSTTPNAKNSKYDCMTAYTRVLSNQEREKFSQFSSLVDRELWSIASAATFFKLPFSALKIISDDKTLTQSEQFDICKFVKDEAPQLSQKMFDEYQSINAPIKKTKTLTNNPFLDDDHFYFTTSQARKLISLSEGLRLKDINLKSINIDEIKMLELTPKDRTRHLLLFLSDLLNPMATKIRNAVGKAISPLSDAGISTHTDPDLEMDWIQLTMKIQSTRDLEKTKNALKLFSYENYKKIFHGELDG